MNTLPIRSLLALSVTALLAACGAGTEQPSATQTAAMVQVSGAPTQAVVAAGAATADAPKPDCAADGCKSLRIIDANAEMFRLEAQRRAALDAGGDPQA